MTNFCKSNVRRVINYTNHEPVNKYDLWLSENLRYNEDGELEYDNNGLQACDLILKIFRNGKWEPIVGYNTTAGNKINIVKDVDYTYTIPNYSTSHINHGFLQNHLPLFRNPSDSPNELFDAGTLGEALTGFVTYDEWSTLFQTSWFTNAFNTNIIGGNNYNWGNLIQNLISSGDIDLPLATYEDIGGIRCQTDTTDLDYRGLPVVFGGPNAGLTYSGNTPTGFTLYGDSLTYNSDNSFLYIPGWALNDWLQDPTGQGTALPFPIDPGSIVISLNTVLKNTSSIGWRIITTDQNPSISPDIWGVDTGNAGKFLKIKDLREWPSIPSGESEPAGGWNQSNNVIDWVDLPTYTGNNLIKVDGLLIGIDTTTYVPNNGDIIIYDSGEVRWSTPPGQTYSAGIGIDIDNSNAISQNITKAIPEASGIINTIGISWTSATNSFTVSYNLGQDEDVSLYQVIDFNDVLNLNSEVDYTIAKIPFNANPAYFILRRVKGISVAQDQEVINLPNNFVGITGILVTVQFGILKFDIIETSGS